MSFEEKMAKLLEHWVKHNSDHAGTYRLWAGRARENGMADISALLEDVAESAEAINKKFEEAAGLIGNK